MGSCWRGGEPLERRLSGIRRCCSSVVEHSLGKGEVESSIPSSSTMILLDFLLTSLTRLRVKPWTSKANLESYQKGSVGKAAGKQPSCEGRP
jgi:hypothetical protein